MTTFEITRTYAHRTYGEIASSLKLTVTGVDKVTLDGAVLPERSVEYLLTFALQSLQDAYAGAKSRDEAQAMFDKKLDAVKAGTIGVRGTGAGVDSFTKTCRQIAREMLRNAYAKEGKAYGDFTSLSAETQNEKLDLLVEKRRDVIEAEAKKRIAAKAKLADAVDLDGLGL